MINSKGEDVGVLHAYAHAMCALLESKPSHFAVCFDSKGNRFVLTFCGCCSHHSP